MKKFIIALTIVLAFAVVVPTFAKGPSASAGKSNKAHLYLYEKDPATWNAIEDGAWGKMTYDKSGDMFDFVFNGHGLEPEVAYTLIYYPDPWPGDGLICLGDGIANGGGNVHIKSTKNTGDLPKESDDNYYWQLTGDWDIDVLYGSTHYLHDMNISAQSEGDLTGTGDYPSGATPTITWVLKDSFISGLTVDLTLDYDGSGYEAYLTGTLDPVSGIISGDWYSNASQAGTWSAVYDGTLSVSGAKIWLVITDDVECEEVSHLSGWNPTEYLFEFDLITFN